MGKTMNYDPDKDVPGLEGKVILITGGKLTTSTIDAFRLQLPNLLTQVPLVSAQLQSPP